MAWTGRRTLVTVGLAAGVLVLYLLGADKQRNGGTDGTEPTANTSQCRVAVTGDGVRLRTAPVIEPGNIVRTAARGEEFDAEKTVQNGFRKIGDSQWLATDFLRTVDGRDCG